MQKQQIGGQNARPNNLFAEAGTFSKNISSCIEMANKKRLPINPDKTDVPVHLSVLLFWRQE